MPGVSIETDSEVVGLGVRALLTPVLGELWRTGAGVGGVRTLSVDLGAFREVRTVVLEAPRDGLLPEAGAAIQVQLSALGMGQAEAGYFSGPLALPAGYWGWVLQDAVMARYLRLRLTSAQPYLQFGRLWVGGGLWCPRNLSESGYDPTTSDTAAMATLRRMQVTLPGLTQDQADQLDDIGFAAGTERQILAIARSERVTRTTVIGKLVAIPAAKPRQAWNAGGLMHTATLTIQEDR